MSCASALVFLLAWSSCQEPREAEPAPAAIPVTLNTARPARGVFRAEGDELFLATADRYDCVAWLGWIDAERYAVTVELTHEDGLLGAGLVFGALAATEPIPDLLEGPTPRFAEMLRFDGPGELLHGAFARGQFEAVGRIALPAPIARGTRVALTIEVDALARRYDVSVDEVVVARGLPLRAANGLLGVQGSLGRVRFHALRARGRAGVRRLVWPDAFVPCATGFAVRSADGSALLLPRDGAPPRPWPAADPIAWSTATEVAGAKIVGGVVELADGHRFSGRELGPFDAVALARDLDGTLLALDQTGARVVAVPASGDDTPETLRFPTAESVQFEPPRAAFALDAEGRFVGASDARGRIGPLAASTRHVLHAAPGTRTWPPDARFVAIPFTSPPPAGTLRVRRLPIVVGIFGAVADDAAELAALPAVRPEDSARFEQELRDCAAWYFHHSGYRLWLDLHFVHRAAPVATAALSATGEPNGTPPRAVLEALAADAKLPLAELAGFCVVMDAKARGAEDRPWRRTGGGGGLTLGAHGSGYGISWFFVPPTPGMVGWLACHELHHQLDALFEISGLPEYPFNHFAPSLRNVAFFGEHWDGNAWILRSWPAHRWDALRFGDDVLVADADGDGLPDGDARLPFDEDRFGSDPRRADSDGDGLDDRAEARGAAWLRESGFETQLAPVRMPNPRRADSDGDGRSDAQDEFPLLPFEPTLHEERRVELGRIDDPQLTAEVSLAYVDGALELCTQSPDAAGLEVQVMLDDGADGWFDGQDNLRIRSRGDSARVLEAFDASSRTEWPRSAPERARSVAVSARLEPGWQVLRIPFPRVDGAARRFGLAIAYRGRLAEPGDPRWYTLFAPHTLVPFALDASKR